MSKEIKQITNLVVFQSKNIRRIHYKSEWYYSVVDIVAALTDSPTPRQYWGKVKNREFIKIQLSPIWVQLKLLAKDGKKYKTDCVNTKSALRLIQSIPSKKAEPFKRWLAQVGQDRLDEIENPELAQERMKEIYEKKGYPKDWIDKRLRGKRKYLPYAFTEQGVAMLSAVLRSDRAIKASIQIMDAFVDMRHIIAKNTLIMNQMSGAYIWIK